MSAFLNVEDHTPCYGKGRLFESTNRADHIQAKALCKTCPAIVACAELLADERANKLNGAGPVGTWAGQLVGKHGGQGRRPLSRECGSDRGYYQHINNDESACRECKAAHAAAERERVAS